MVVSATGKCKSGKGGRGAREWKMEPKEAEKQLDSSGKTSLAKTKGGAHEYGESEQRAFHMEGKEIQIPSDVLVDHNKELLVKENGS